jgi:NADH dehydrogenase
MSTATSDIPADSPAPAPRSIAPEPSSHSRPRRPLVVVIGGGFGGLAAVKHLAGEEMDITLLDRSNHHLFQPLLYQVATAGLSPANIARPLREIFSQQRNVEVILSEAKRIDVTKRQVVTEDLVIDYDFLIVATGSRHSYFGHDEWEQFAPGLKTLADAVEIRKRMLVAFEIAEKALDPAERHAALTFVVVGGGPTGVEMAGAISEIARHTMTRDFRRIEPGTAHVLLVEGAPRVLSGFTEDLSASAQKQLEEIGVEVHTGVVVTNVTAEGVEIKDGEFIPARTVVWAAGNAASPLGKTLGATTDRAGRVVVNEDLTIADHPEVQVIGDMANFSYQTGKPLPGVSPTAMQQGRHAANNIREILAGGKPMNFHYWDKGSMATIGRNKAVADLHFIRFGGFLAWAAWALIHVAFLVGFRNRLAVMSEWAYNYITFYRGARLITGTQTGFESLRKPAPGSDPHETPDGGVKT